MRLILLIKLSIYSIIGKCGDRHCARQSRRLPHSVSRPQGYRGDNIRLSARRHCLYNHAEKLQTADKESPSGPKHTCNQCSHQSAKLHK